MGKCAQEMLSWNRAFVKKHPGKKARDLIRALVSLTESQHERDARIWGF